MGNVVVFCLLLESLAGAAFSRAAAGGKQENLQNCLGGADSGAEGFTVMAVPIHQSVGLAGSPTVKSRSLVGNGGT